MSDLPVEPTEPTPEDPQEAPEAPETPAEPEAAPAEPEAEEAPAEAPEPPVDHVAVAEHTSVLVHVEQELRRILDLVVQRSSVEVLSREVSTLAEDLLRRL